jgi:hypothetical protein
MRNLLILIAFGITIYMMGKTGDLLWLVAVLPLGVMAGIIAAKADEVDRK